MVRVSCLAAAAALMLSAATVSAQSHTFDFEDATDQGWGTGFGNDASASFVIVNVAGSNRMLVPRTGFQSAGCETGNPGSTFFQAMAAAAANEAGYELSYDWYIDTAGWGAGAGGFLQGGSFVNTGSGAYNQDFGAIKEFELNGTQLASGQIFSGHVAVNMAAAGLLMPSGETFFRVGLILNGDGAAGVQKVHYDNVRISPVPEPASMALLALAVPAMMIRRRGA